MPDLLINEFYKNIRRNTVLAIVLSLMCVVTILSVSVIRTVLNEYGPFRQFEGKNGFFYVGQDLDGIYSEVQESYTYSIGNACYGDTNVDVMGLGSWFYDNFSQRLKEGRWLFTSDDTDAIPAVLETPVDNLDIHAGDTLTLTSGDGTTHDFFITGVLEKNITLPSFGGSFNAANISYKNYYKISYSEMLLLTDQAILSASGFSSATHSNHIVVTENNSEELTEAIFNISGSEYIDLPGFIENSRLLLKRELTLYLPLMTISGIVMILCMTAFISLNVRRSLPHHSVYYLVGASRRKLFSLASSSNIGIIIYSAAFLTAICAVLSSLKLNKWLLVKYDFITIIWIAAIYIVFMISGTLIYAWNMRSASPKKLIISRKT